jgi:hypothetical protein
MKARKIGCDVLEGFVGQQVHASTFSIFHEADDVQALI